MIGERLNPNILNQKYDCIIIGSGISGLCSASLLSKMGKKVLVLEKHYMIGGLTHCFSRKGYEWDVGLHYVGNVHNLNHPYRILFDYITDSELKWNFMGEEYDRLIFPDQDYSFKAGTENFIAEMSMHFPQESQAIKNYVELIKKVAESVGNFFLARNFPKFFGNTISDKMSKQFTYYSSLSTYDALKQLTQNEKLIAVLTGQYGDYALPPKKSSFGMHSLVAYHYIKGGNYPVGGSSEIAKTIVKVINKNGGKIVFNAGVANIIVKNGKAIGVKLDKGEEVFAENIISSAGAHITYNQLLSREDLGDNFFERVKDTPYSTSALGLYIGFKENSDKILQSKSNLWIYPSYDHDKNINNYLADQNQELPITYISFPSSKDPTFNERFQNRSTVAMLGAAPYSWFTKWEETKWRRRGAEYEDYKESLAKKYLEVLYKHVPNTKGKVDYYEVSTPLSNKRFTHYPKGEIYGLEFSPKRMKEKWIGTRTPLKNLYLTGQDSLAPGISGALMSGLMTTFTISPLKTIATVPISCFIKKP